MIPFVVEIRRVAFVAIWSILVPPHFFVVYLALAICAVIGLEGSNFCMSGFFWCSRCDFFLSWENITSKMVAGAHQRLAKHIAAHPLVGVLNPLVRRYQSNSPDEVVGGCFCKGCFTCGQKKFSAGRIGSELLLHNFECDLFQVILPQLLVEILHTTPQLLHSRWIFCSFNVLPDVFVAHQYSLRGHDCLFCKDAPNGRRESLTQYAGWQSELITLRVKIEIAELAVRPAICMTIETNDPTPVFLAFEGLFLGFRWVFSEVWILHPTVTT